VFYISPKNIFPGCKIENLFLTLPKNMGISAVCWKTNGRGEYFDRNEGK
jgi:hypothetical protein